MTSLFKRTYTFLDMIRFEHTVFALPFAYLGMILAAKGLPAWDKVFWITLAMAAARTAGMSLNRYIDRFIDAKNPRTQARPIQANKISSRAVLFGAIISLILLALSAWMLNLTVFFLFPGALFFLVIYSYSKRFTWMSHFILGFTDGLAPAGAWVAITGTFWLASDIPAWLLLFALTVWIGGFDLIYACQDIEFDGREGLKSIPMRFGIAFALRLAQICHALTVIALGSVGGWFNLGIMFWMGLAAITVLFVWEHTLVKPHDLSKVDMAFFNVNGYISLTIFVGTVLAIWMK